MSPSIENHSVTIQFATIIVIVLSLVGFTYRFATREALYASRISALETKQAVMDMEIGDVAREGTQRGLKLMEITTELKNISDLLSEIRDKLR